MPMRPPLHLMVCALMFASLRYTVISVRQFPCQCLLFIRRCSHIVNIRSGATQNDNATMLRHGACGQGELQCLK